MLRVTHRPLRPSRGKHPCAVVHLRQRRVRADSPTHVRLRGTRVMWRRVCHRWRREGHTIRTPLWWGPRTLVGHELWRILARGRPWKTCRGTGDPVRLRRAAGEGDGVWCPVRMGPRWLRWVVDAVGHSGGLGRGRARTIGCVLGGGLRGGRGSKADDEGGFAPGAEGALGCGVVRYGGS